MNLEIGGERSIPNPSAAQIAEELAALPGGIDSFAILSRSELTYLQTAGGGSEGFVLEYQEGSIENHYRSVDPELPLGTVTNTFQMYAAEDPAWRKQVEWEHADLSQLSAGIPFLPIALIGAAAIALALWWWRAS